MYDNISVADAQNFVSINDELQTIIDIAYQLHIEKKILFYIFTLKIVQVNL